MSMAKRPHWTTGEVLQQILGCEEPAENDIEDPVVEVARDSQSMEGSDDELLIGKTLERSLEVSITCTNILLVPTNIIAALNAWREKKVQ